MKLHTLLSLIVMILLVHGGSISLALTPIEEAKSQGFLGETQTGYLELVNPGAPNHVKALMKDINQKRKRLYQDIARKKGVELKKVEALSAEKAIKKTKQGHFIKLPSGWKKKS